MTRTRMLLTGLVVAVLGSAPVNAAPPMGPPHMGPPTMHGDSSAMMLHMVLTQADLTPQQQEQVRTIMDSDHQTLRTLFTQLQAANDQLADKLFAPGAVQPADLAPQVQRITELRQQLMEQGIKTALAIRAVLTPQQLAKVSQIKDRLEKLQAEMRSLLKDDD
jgi:Spy/CpxP family protein refolding chaperone